ncbi:MAG: hypothetical protein P8P29_07795 [Flavobacteriaceae bacterium]|nr:hypothetical protein [Flavobacteriaceae bacterium]
MAVFKPDVLSQSTGLDPNAIQASNPSEPLRFDAIFQGMAQGEQALNTQDNLNLRRDQMEISQEQLKINQDANNRANKDLSFKMELHEFDKKKSQMELNKLAYATLNNTAENSYGIEGIFSGDAEKLNKIDENIRLEMERIQNIPDPFEMMTEANKLSIDVKGNRQLTDIKNRTKWSKDFITTMTSKDSNLDYKKVSNFLTNKLLNADYYNEKLESGEFSNVNDLKNEAIQFMVDPLNQRFDLVKFTTDIGAIYNPSETLTELKSLGFNKVGQEKFDFMPNKEALKEKILNKIKLTPGSTESILETSNSIDDYVESVISNINYAGYTESEEFPGYMQKQKANVNQQENTQLTKEQAAKTKIEIENNKARIKAEKERLEQAELDRKTNYLTGTIGVDKDGTITSVDHDHKGLFTAQSREGKTMLRQAKPIDGTYLDEHNTYLSNAETNVTTAINSLSGIVDSNGKPLTYYEDGKIKLNVDSIVEGGIYKDQYGNVITEQTLRKLHVLKGEQSRLNGVKRRDEYLDTQISTKYTTTNKDYIPGRSGQYSEEGEYINENNTNLTEFSTNYKNSANRIKELKTKHNPEGRIQSTPYEMMAFSSNTPLTEEIVREKVNARKLDWSDEKIEDVVELNSLYNERKEMKKKYKEENGYSFKYKDGDDLRTLYSKNSKFHKNVIEKDYEELAQRQYAQDMGTSSELFFTDKKDDQYVALEQELANQPDIFDMYNAIDDTGKRYSKADYTGNYSGYSISGAVWDRSTGTYKTKIVLSSDKQENTSGRLISVLDSKVNKKVIYLDMPHVDDIINKGVYKQLNHVRKLDNKEQVDAGLAESFATQVASETGGLRFAAELDNVLATPVTIEPYNNGASKAFKIRYRDPVTNEIVESIEPEISNVGIRLAELSGKKADSYAAVVNNFNAYNVDEAIQVAELNNNYEKLYNDNSTAVGIYMHMWGKEFPGPKEWKGHGPIIREKYPEEFIKKNGESMTWKEAKDHYMNSRELNQKYQDVEMVNIKKYITSKTGLRSLQKKYGGSISDGDLVYHLHHNGLPDTQKYIRGEKELSNDFKAGLARYQKTRRKSDPYYDTRAFAGNSKDSSVKMENISIELKEAISFLPNFDADGKLITEDMQGKGGMGLYVTSAQDFLYSKTKERGGSSNGPKSHVKNSWHEYGYAIDFRMKDAEGGLAARNMLSMYNDPKSGLKQMLKSRGFVLQAHGKDGDDNYHIHMEPIAGTKKPKKK